MIKAVFALFILVPYIEPLLSSKKIYYPLAFYISMDSFELLAIAALSASPRERWQNLGMKETITVVFESFLPTEKLGSSKCSVV